MNVYLFITLVGLVFKLGVSYNIVFNFPKPYEHLRAELIAFMITFLAFSLVLILLFGPESWAVALGIERIYVIRLYYFGDGLSVIVGGYLLMSMFHVRFHKNLAVLLVVVLFIVIGGYFLVLTPLMVDGVRPGPRGLITLSEGAEYVYIGQIIVYICTAAIVISLIRSYHSARSSHAQIKNVYALAAALVYDVSCLIGLYYAFPLLMASRGLIFYVVVMLILQRERFFDIRPVAPTTIEANAMREFGRIFRKYSAEDLGHREAIKLMEKELISYKLEKITGFKEGRGSSLPLVAESMRISLSTLYDVLKRHDIEKPNKQRR